MKKQLCSLTAAVILLLSGCGRPDIPTGSLPPYSVDPDDAWSMEQVTDPEILSALRAYKAGTFGWKHYYNNMLNQVVSSSYTKLYSVDTGITNRFFCAYMRTDAYAATDVSGHTDWIYYLPGEEYVDGKHLGYYDGDAEEVTVWYQIGAEEEIPQEIVCDGVGYTLDLVMAEKIYNFLYDCSAGVPMQTRLSCFVRYPLQLENGELVLSDKCKKGDYLGDNSHKNDWIFLNQSGEYVTIYAPHSTVSEKYKPVNKTVSDRHLYAVREIDGRRYMEFPACDNDTKEEFLSFCCDSDDTYRNRYSDAFLSVDGTTYLDLAVLFPPAE